MNTSITINPITRISGFLEIKVELQDNKVADAKSSGLLFRGFEEMLKGRSPLDAIYFTERICGICSTAHSMASTLALENALSITPDENSRMIRDLAHGFEFIQNHLRHFYLYSLPDFIQTPNIQPLYSDNLSDFRLPVKVNKRIEADYLEAIKYSRIAHEGLAVIGGKVPHNHGIFVGGVTVNLDAYKLARIKSIINNLYAFVSNRMIEDAYTIGAYYSDYFRLGSGTGNLMSYGLFNNYKDNSLFYVNPKVLINNKITNLETENITENIYNSWYSGENIESNLYSEPVQPDVQKKNAYSFVKAPRYKGQPMEVGPLARMILSGNYNNKISTMDRIIARALETKKILEIMKELTERIVPQISQQKAYEIPVNSKGSGLIDTTRGSLGHWLSIENNKIGRYNIITPSVWNCSPTDSNGIKGVIESSLIGIEIKDINKPSEIGRTIRSFDPCISCATHIISSKFKPLQIII